MSDKITETYNSFSNLDYSKPNPSPSKPKQRGRKPKEEEKNQVITIKELDPEMLDPLTEKFMDPNYMGGVKYIVIGKPNTGKTNLIKSLLYAKKHIIPVGVAFNGTEDTNHSYGYSEHNGLGFMPDSFVYPDYKEKDLEEVIKRQKLAIAHLKNPWIAIIIDDCSDDPRMLNTPLQNAMYKKGRHWKMMYILALQYAMDVKPVVRNNTDGIFILREPNVNMRKKLWENYASIVPTFELFCDIMDQLTEDKCAIYIHNFSTTNNWQDCVFYWNPGKAKENWKFGSSTYWDHHEQRYNSSYIDPITGA